MTDPAHPLFGRTFEIDSARGRADDGTLFVRYRDGILLRVPKQATDRAISRHATPRDRLSTRAVQEFLSLVKEYAACPIFNPEAMSAPTKSGGNSRPQTKPKSSKN